MTPYSALAGGRLSKLTGETSKRLVEDSYARSKYGDTVDSDSIIIGRVSGIAQKYGVSMTEVSLAWLIAKGTIPVVGATKIHHIEGAANAVNLHLSEKDISYLEEAYVPHRLVGVMANNNK